MEAQFPVCMLYVQALLATEGVDVEFTDAALRSISTSAEAANRMLDNIGARRLHTVLVRERRGRGALHADSFLMMPRALWAHCDGSKRALRCSLPRSSPQKNRKRSWARGHHRLLILRLNSFVLSYQTNSRYFCGFPNRRESWVRSASRRPRRSRRQSRRGCSGTPMWWMRPRSQRSWRRCSRSRTYRNTCFDGDTDQLTEHAVNLSHRVEIVGSHPLVHTLNWQLALAQPLIDRKAKMASFIGGTFISLPKDMKIILEVRGVRSRSIFPDALSTIWSSWGLLGHAAGGSPS